MHDDISIAGFRDLTQPESALRTGNVDGILAVDTLHGGGSYARQAPLKVDTTDLDDDLQGRMREILRQTTQSFPDMQCATFKDAMIAGQGSVVTRNGKLIRESAIEFLAAKTPPEGFSFSDSQERLRLAATENRRVRQPTLLLKRPWWRNYGHWLIDSAALLAIASRMTMPNGWQVVVGRQESPKMKEVVQQTIAILAPGVPILEHPDGEAWIFDQLIYCAPVHVPPLFKHPEGLACLRAGVLRKSLAQSAFRRRIFVSRGSHPSRRLENEPELIEIASAHGYEHVRPEGLDFLEQARLFHSSDCIVGVKGAALSNIIFCSSRASVLVLSPGDFPDPFFWDLASHSAVTYSEIFGRLTTRDKPRSANSFVIDPAQFNHLLPM